MKHRVNPCRKMVSEYALLLRKGKKLAPASGKQSGRRSQVSDQAPRALIFSPHPDDECIVGGLPLRLLREAKWKVINVAVTLGSNPSRRPERLRELCRACARLGFDVILTGSPRRDGLGAVHPETRKRNRSRWKAAVRVMAKILAENRPRVIFLPHERDVHPAHVGTHFLVSDALKTLPADFRCYVVETEFWGQMSNPNLLVESDVEDVGDLVAALACHVGEVRRNAYHARLPAWMMDNVRRGAELVGGPSPRRSGFVHAGGTAVAAPDFTFATIYRLQKWSRGRLTDALKGGKYLSHSENAAGLF